MKNSLNNKSFYIIIGWKGKYGLLLFLLTVVTYFCGIIIDKIKNKENKKNTVAIGFFINLFILFFFKYFEFFVENINSFFNIIKVKQIEKSLDIILPIGILFYTLQSLSYIVDVYRKDVKVEKIKC